MSAPLRIGLVGCGRLAELGYAPAARASARVEITALADPDAGRLACVAAAAEGAPATHASVEELLEAGDAEALVVCSPPRHHEHAAAAAAAAGVRALVEKPPAPDADGTARIADLRLAPWIGMNRRFSLGRGLAGALPEGGTIELELRYRRFSWAPVSVRDPALTDLAPHLIDLALLAGIGEPRSVRADSPRPERVSIEIAGVRGSARIRCACDRAHREDLVVRDPSGAVVERRRIGGPGRALLGRIAPGPHPLVSSLRDQLEAFARVAAGEELPPGERPATAAEGLAAMRVVAVAAASLARGGERVEPALAGRA